MFNGEHPLLLETQMWGGLFAYFLSFDLFSAPSQGSYTCESAHSVHPNAVSFNKTRDIMS